MFKIHYTSGYAEVVETVDEAVGIGWANDAFVSVLNRPKMGATEAERTIYERISCLDADDEWVGARFEADVGPESGASPARASGSVAVTFLGICTKKCG